MTEFTKRVLKSFATKNEGAPYVDDEKLMSVRVFDESLYDHIRTAIHSLTVDSASDEIASAENMRSDLSSTATADGAFTPNLSIVIHHDGDKAHASRRILQRPWGCDQYLSAVAASLITETGSLAQTIQHSEDFRSWYEECSAASSKKPVTTVFSHMRAAKHRYESLSAPLSRMCLDWQAVVDFLCRVALERKGDGSGAFAVATLIALDEEMLLQAALLADACSLSSKFVASL